MNTIVCFLGGVALSLIFSFATIAAIRTSYREILEELCGTAQRAGYWIRTSEVCLVVITVFAAITFHGYRGLERPDAVELFWSLTRQVACILAAVFLSLIVITRVVLKNLPHQGKPTQLPNAGAGRQC